MKKMSLGYDVKVLIVWPIIQSLMGKAIVARLSSSTCRLTTLAFSRCRQFRQDDTIPPCFRTQILSEFLEQIGRTHIANLENKDTDSYAIIVHCSQIEGVGTWEVLSVWLSRACKEERGTRSLY